MAPLRPVVFYGVGAFLVVIGAAILIVTVMSLATGAVLTVAAGMACATVLAGFGLIAAGVHRWDCNRLGPSD